MTSHCYCRAYPNFIFRRFQCNIRSKRELLEGIKFKNRHVSEFKTSYAFTIKREIAAIIANKVMSSVLEKNGNTTVIEINPGPGLISQELFRNELDKLIVYDKLNMPHFTKCLGDNVEKINLIRKELLRYHGFKLSRFYSMLNKDIHYTVILSLPHRRFFSRLFFHIVVFQWNLITNVEFYLTVSESVLECLVRPEGKFTKIPDYGLCSVLFDVEILDKFKYSDFFPLGLRKEKLYFIRFRRKAKPLLTERFAKTYFLFLLQITQKKNEPLLKILESWYRGIGPAAIARGIKATNLIRDFNGEELLKIFFMIKDLGYDIGIFNKIQPLETFY